MLLDPEYQAFCNRYRKTQCKDAHVFPTGSVQSSRGRDEKVKHFLAGNKRRLGIEALYLC